MCMELDSNYVIGLTDGEGSFTAYVKNPDSIKKVKRRTKVEPRFFLKLIEKDAKILHKLKKFFGCGSVYFQKDKRPNHQNCYRYEVANRNDLEKIIIPFFKRNSLQLRSKKSDFEIFCRIVRMVMQNKHLNQSGLKAIFNLKQKMH